MAQAKKKKQQSEEASLVVKSTRKASPRKRVVKSTSKVQQKSGPIVPPEARVRKKNRRIIKKLDKKVKKTVKLPKARVIFWGSLKHLWKFKRLFAGIIVVLLLLNFIFVQGLAARFDLGGTKQSLQDLYGGQLAGFDMTATLFGSLIGTAGASQNASASVFQVLLLLIASVAVIWALRHTYAADKSIKVKAVFYKSTGQIIQFTLVVFLLFLQTIPMLIGVSVYSMLAANGQIVGPVESIAALVVLFGCIYWTVYLMSASIFALYIVTLDAMTPVKALRMARRLVKFRRAAIIRKLLYLPFVLVLIVAAVFLPLVYISPIAAEVLFLISTMLGIVVIHSYLYRLYRAML